MSSTTPNLAPKSITAMLRLEGFVALAAACTAYWYIGGNWWLFAILLLAPDLSFLGYYAGQRTGARIYNLAHTYAVSALLGAIGWFAGVHLLLEIGLIWAAHIGMDRAFGYGLKYPGIEGQTHLGPIGKGRKLASAG